MDRRAPEAYRRAGLEQGLEKGLELVFSFKIYFFGVQFEQKTPHEVHTAKKSDFATAKFALHEVIENMK